MPSLGRAPGWAVWEATVNSCQKGSLFIVSSRIGDLDRLGPPDHAHLAAGWLLLKLCVQLQGLY